MTKYSQYLALVCLGASLFSASCTACPVADVSVIAHTGEPVGVEVQHDNMTLYITGQPSDTAVLYLTDVFGIQLRQNKLLADSFGRAGYLTVAPDMFNGTPAPGDLNDPGFNLTGFLNQHGPEVIDPMLKSTISFIREKFGIERIVSSGYCYGGRYTFRLLSQGHGVSAGFAAHPSLLEDDEIVAIAGPASVAAADHDTEMPVERRHAIEAQLGAAGEPYSLALYSGTQHGFGVSANVSDPQQRFAKEDAFFQAVRWFESWA